VTDVQANDIVENTMKAHWTNWNFAGQELKVWIEELRKFDYETARTAINELYKSWDKDRYPKMPQILRAIRSYCKMKKQVGRKIAPLFEILRADGKRLWAPFAGDITMAKEEIERIAEFYRNEADCLESTQKHIIKYRKIQSQTEPEASAESDDIPF
jgi:hypothetical protein